MNNNIFHFFFYLKIISLVLICLFAAGIFWYAKKLKIIPKKIENFKNWLGVNPFLESSSKSKREWQAIRTLIEEPYESSWKLAVLKTDSLLERFLKQIGFQGDTFEELLDSLRLRGYQNLELLKGAHQVAEEILKNKDYSLSQKEALSIISIYKKFWDELAVKIL